MRPTRLLAFLCFISLTIASCGSEPSSPFGGGERAPAPADLDLGTDAAIMAALDACNDNGTGQGTSASTRYENAIRKYDSGDTAGGQAAMLELLQWEYERVDLGKWLCSPEEFVSIMTAIVNRVELAIPIAYDGGLCTGDHPEGCPVVSNDGCSGIVTPNPQQDFYYISFEEIDSDPFIGKSPIFNSYAPWVDVKVFDINGNEVVGADFTADPATVALVTEGEIPVAETGLALGHLVNAGTAQERVEILAPGTRFLSLATCSIQTADAGFLEPLAALFRIDPAFAGGTSLGGAISSFSSVAPIDPKSDTNAGISPTSTTLTDLQSVTLTATVTAVDGVDTDGNVYPAPAVGAGDPLHFVIDGAPLDAVTTSATGTATLTLTCGDELPFGEHEIGVQYEGTDIHAASATTDGDSPTGSATVVCTTPFQLINFDRDPANDPLKNGEIVDATYASLGVRLSRVGGGTLCSSGHAYAVSDPNTGHYGSPPRVVSPCEDSSPFSANGHGWIQAMFDTPQSEVCVAVFPTAGQGKKKPVGEIVAYDEAGSQIAVASGQDKLVCVAKGKGRTAPGIKRVEFAGQGDGLAKFDNLRYR